jgi:hypothetical protein
MSGEPLTRDTALDRLAEVLSGCNRAGDMLGGADGEPWPVPTGSEMSPEGRAYAARRFQQTRRALLEVLLTWRPAAPAPTTPSSPARPPPRPAPRTAAPSRRGGVVATLLRVAVGRWLA